MNATESTTLNIYMKTTSLQIVDFCEKNFSMINSMKQLAEATRKNNLKQIKIYLDNAQNIIFKAPHIKIIQVLLELAEQVI